MLAGEPCIACGHRWWLVTTVDRELLSLCKAAVRVTEKLIKTDDNCKQTFQIRPFKIHRKEARLQHPAKEIAREQRCGLRP